MDLLESIKNHQADFSKSELKVMDYILSNPDNVETFTITKIATEGQTSTSAVLRFCQTLGFNGYKDFRFEMIDYLHSRRDKTSPDSLVDKYLDGYMKTINQMHDLDFDKVNLLIDALVNQKMNYILGIYYSSLPARALYLGLSDMGRVSLFANDYMISEHLTRSINDDSTFVFFSINGDKANFKYFMADVANKMPENSFLITLNPKAELSEIFPNTIVLPGRTFSSQAVVDTQAVPMLFVELLLNLINEKI